MVVWFAVPKTEPLVPIPGTLARRRVNPNRSQSTHCKQLGLIIEILARALHKQWRQSIQTLMQNFESTYALLILSAAFSIWQFAHQTVAFPIDKLANATVCATEPHRS